VKPKKPNENERATTRAIRYANGPMAMRAPIRMVIEREIKERTKSKAEQSGELENCPLSQKKNYGDAHYSKLAINCVSKPPYTKYSNPSQIL